MDEYPDHLDMGHNVHKLLDISKMQVRLTVLVGRKRVGALLGLASARSAVHSAPGGEGNAGSRQLRILRSELAYDRGVLPAR